MMLLIMKGRSKNWDERITLNSRDKIPYGTAVAFNQLKYIYPGAEIHVNKKEPGYWNYDMLDAEEDKQAIIIITKRFNATNAELVELFNFVSNGNNVFISAYEFSYDTEAFFRMRSSFAGGYDIYGLHEDSLQLHLEQPPFYNTPDYSYPGKRFTSYFSNKDTSMTYVLGTSPDSLDVFIKLSAGKGNFFLHSAPLSFSNYFLLYRDNINYYNHILSTIPADTKKIVWDEYFHRKPASNKPPDRSPFRVLMQQPAFRAGIYTALAALLLFVLLGLKRKQRMVPHIQPLSNDSLDFVKTIGRLYFQKKDNHNLAAKMTSFFAEYVYTHYHISASEMNGDFVLRLSQKSGASESLVKAIAASVRLVHEGASFTDQELIDYYLLLDQFYKTV